MSAGDGWYIDGIDMRRWDIHCAVCVEGDTVAIIRIWIANPCHIALNNTDTCIIALCVYIKYCWSLEIISKTPVKNVQALKMLEY